MEDNKIDLTQYFNRFYRTVSRVKKWLIIIVVCTTVLNLAKTFLFFKTTYTSQSVFVVYEQDQDNIFEVSDDGDSLFSSFSGLLCGSMMQDVVKTNLGLTDFPASISLNRFNDTNLAVLKVVSQDSKLSYDIINCILNNYKQVTDYSMSDINIAIIDTPEQASKPDAYPDYLKDGVIGFAIGIIIDLGIVFILMTARKTILESEDVKKELHLHNIH